MTKWGVFINGSNRIEKIDETICIDSFLIIKINIRKMVSLFAKSKNCLTEVVINYKINLYIIIIYKIMLKIIFNKYFLIWNAH